MGKKRAVEPSEPTAKVEIMMCPAHRYYAVAINDGRITPDKCCGSWTVQKTWNVDPAYITRNLEK